MSKPSPNTIHIPQVTIQHDVQAVVDDIAQGTVSDGEDVWISCYQTDAPTIHGKASVVLKDGIITMKGREGVQIERLNTTTYKVDCPQLGIKGATLKSPRKAIGESKAQEIPKAIHAFDVSPNGALYAAGHPDGSVIVGSTGAQASSPPKTFTPHLSNVLSLRFFPSSEVILTSSGDMSLSVISALDLSVPRKLKGHSRAVSDTAIIDRGKNVLSCGKDGTVRLWDVGGGKQIKLMGVDSYSPVLKMALGKTSEEILMPPPLGEPPQPTSDSNSRRLLIGSSEVETGDKLACCALQNGRFTLLDLGTKLPAFTSSSEVKGSALYSIAYSPGHRLLATGSLDGHITLYDIRSLAYPLFTFRRNGACVEDLAFALPSTEASTADLIVGTEDGLPFRASVRPEGPRVVEEYVGYDCDAVRVVRVSGGAVWTAGDDGIVRKY